MLIHWHKKNPAGNPGGTDGRKTKLDGEQTIINSSKGNLFRFTDDLLINASTFCFFLLSSRLYCRCRNFTSSVVHSNMHESRTFTAGREFCSQMTAGTLPRRNHFLKMPENDVSINVATKIWFFDSQNQLVKRW